jgi:hypothetical protein
MVELEELQAAVVKVPARATQVKEACGPSLYLVDYVLQAWYVKLLPSRGLVALVKTSLDMSDRRADHVAAAPVWYLGAEK